MADDSLKYGGFYFSTSATTTLSAATPAKAAGTTTAFSLNGFTHTTDNRLTYTGTATRIFHVAATLSVASVTGAETLQFYIYKNGSAITGGAIHRKVSNNDIGAVAINCIVSLATNDYVEVWVASTGGDDVVVNYGQVVVKVAG